ncbi:MAG: hypothetical protein COB46_09175 [Rhodospirillaceae bacterium]|nr:MAG: hypothetical protein COB46_09175 [Rhodospirillaceae bacterium]
MIMFKPLALAVLMALTSTAWAGEADVVDAKINKTSSETYRISVSVLHADSGWDHYANSWEVLDQNGTVLGTRVLLHPHENEQPFTRSLSGVKIPKGTSKITIRAHDLVHEFGGKTLTLSLHD